MGLKSNRSHHVYNNNLKSYSMSAVFQILMKLSKEKQIKLSALSNVSSSLLSLKNC